MGNETTPLLLKEGRLAKRVGVVLMRREATAGKREALLNRCAARFLKNHPGASRFPLLQKEGRF
jgi:hypothetical protein